MGGWVQGTAPRTSPPGYPPPGPGPGQGWARARVPIDARHHGRPIGVIYRAVKSGEDYREGKSGRKIRGENLGEGIPSLPP